jgi:hypothetical protein
MILFRFHLGSSMPCMCMLMVRGWVQNLIQTMEAQFSHSDTNESRNICYRWLSNYQRMMRQRKAKFPCFFLEWGRDLLPLIFVLTCLLSLPYNNDAIQIGCSQQILPVVPRNITDWKAMTLQSEMHIMVRTWWWWWNCETSNASTQQRWTCSLLTHVCFGRVKS